MCHLAFIATNTKIIPEEWNEDGIFFIFNSLEKKKADEIRPKMKNQFIYEIGSFEGCACGFKYDETLFDDLQDLPKLPEIDYEEIARQNTLKIRSIEKLINLIKAASLNTTIECYTCWFDELNLPPKEIIELNIHSIDIRKNYFGLPERIKFIFNNQAIV